MHIHIHTQTHDTHDTSEHTLTQTQTERHANKNTFGASKAVPTLLLRRYPGRLLSRHTLLTRRAAQERFGVPA